MSLIGTLTLLFEVVMIIVVGTIILVAIALFDPDIRDKAVTQAKSAEPIESNGDDTPRTSDESVPRSVNPDDDLAPCKRCTRQISIEARVCPECGWDPSTVGKRGRDAQDAVATWLAGGWGIKSPKRNVNKKRKEAKNRRPTEVGPDDHL